MKKILLFLVGILIVVVLGLVALTAFINPNQFKPMIIEQAKQQTGLDLVIEGDIDWQLFPSIGFMLGKTELKNPQGFSQPNLFKVDRVGVDISVMPLFSQRLEIGNVTLDGAEFYVETRKDGVKNLDALTAEKAQSDEPAPQQTEQTTTASTPDTSAWSMTLAGISVTNGLLEIQDDRAGTHTKLYDLSLTLTEFALEQWSKADFAMKGETNVQTFAAQGTAELKLGRGFDYQLRNVKFDASYRDETNRIDNASIGLESFTYDQASRFTWSVKGVADEMALDLKGGALLTVNQAMSHITLADLGLDATLEGEVLPQSPMKVDMNSDLTFDVTQGQLNFALEKLTANKLAFDGKLNVTLADIPKVVFNLHSPNIDLDEFLGLNQTAQTDTKQPETAPSPETKPKQEPDLSALKALDVTGAITIDKFKASNAKMQNVRAKFTINRGVMTLSSFHSDLYGGAIDATAVLDARKTPATYQAKKTIQGVQIQPLLIDVAQNDTLEGTGNIDVNVKGKGLAPTAMKQNLVGTVKINFADGAVNGINIAQLIRENYAKFKGKKIEEQNVVKRTDFSAMTATLVLDGGVVSTDNLHAQSPLLRVRGQGDANYLKETVDFTISTSVVGSLEGQGGKDIDELKDLTIPVNISGQWADPKFKLVFDDVLKQKAEKEINRGLDKIKDEKTKKVVDGLLKGLFN